MKNIVSCLTFILLSVLVFAQKDSSPVKLNGFFKKANSILNSGKPGAPSLSSNEISTALKEALTIGAQKSTDQLSAADGFFKNAAVKVLLPAEVSKAENKLRMLGMDKLADNVILSLNRAAEDASRSAAPVFIEAIKGITIQDALSILKGTDTAATSYLKRTTSPQLINAFTPIIEASLSKVNATKYWNGFFTAYNKIAFSKVDADLTAYVTAKTLNGIFYYVAEEEKKIRNNPAERVTDILKKVFEKK
ncbi:MAG: DUF4197 domain-containing protein [Ginsengibacter sp.]